LYPIDIASVNVVHISLCVVGGIETVIKNR
jgi:hypothetical protein